ncbi:hypothetical protein [Cupriavidus pauculus]|uniref:hypothetical protein n=1 Tax=Cupriavidus pauculus TaxID=82633 RepID=UPI00124813F0|nr:hypothetical protein [Cupriavidus pauculus]KAB0600275.1 hypothetical protein F7R19_21735 [Cupriavidus pauculus]MCM3608308.1 hypothetical protein [Cupriavidus pauculus]UAL00450.1 hypothetical protein K8O84_03510 [Cupriavidus pauculus]
MIAARPRAGHGWWHFQPRVALRLYLRLVNQPAGGERRDSVSDARAMERGASIVALADRRTRDLRASPKPENKKGP